SPVRPRAARCAETSGAKASTCSGVQRTTGPWADRSDDMLGAYPWGTTLPGGVCMSHDSTADPGTGDARLDLHRRRVQRPARPRPPGTAGEADHRPTGADIGEHPSQAADGPADAGPDQ